MPAAFLVGGDKQTAAELAQMKGQMVAVEQASILPSPRIADPVSGAAATRNVTALSPPVTQGTPLVRFEIGRRLSPTARYSALASAANANTDKIATVTKMRGTKFTILAHYLSRKGLAARDEIARELEPGVVPC